MKFMPRSEKPAAAIFCKILCELDPPAGPALPLLERLPKALAYALRYAKDTNQEP